MSLSQEIALLETSGGKKVADTGARVLFQVCLGCITPKACDNDFRDYYRRQVTQGKVPIKAVVNTMGKLAEIIYHCLKAQEPYQYQGKYRRIISPDKAK